MVTGMAAAMAGTSKEATCAWLEAWNASLYSAAPACHVGTGQWQATRKDCPDAAVETWRWRQQAGRADSARAMGHRYVAAKDGPTAAINARTKRNDPLHPTR